MSRLRLLAVFAMALGLLVVMAVPALAKGNPTVRTQAWVDGELFGSVVTPATFDPANGNFDELYAGCDGAGGFKDGVGLISDAGPGDTDYNGGRWHLNVITDPADCAKYAQADSVDDLDPADFTSTTTHFECPLLPNRGRG